MMRYIGNKSKLLSFLGDFLDDLELDGGTAFDAFSGTATVGRFLKRRGFTVWSCDVMAFSHVYQRAYIVVDDQPRFDAVRTDPEFVAARAAGAFASSVQTRFPGQGDLFGGAPSKPRPLEELLVFLDSYLPPRWSFITQHFSAPMEGASDDQRMYFTQANARRIDAIRIKIEEWRDADALSEDEYFILLACLLEAADAVANTTGVYAAYVKTWQSNALRPLRLTPPHLIAGTGRNCRAHLGNVNEIVGSLGPFDLLYLDPPYNTRQYSGYYHVPELIAKGWFDGLPELRGKTGLIPDAHTKSAWSTRGGCVQALEALIGQAEATHVLMSYNSEGIIPEPDIERIFKARGDPATYRRVGIDYKRYRSDSDHEDRRYKADVVTEMLYYTRIG